MPPLSQSNGTDPGEDAEAVTPHDANDLTYYSRGLYIGGAGDVTVVMQGGQTVTFVGVAGGTLLPIRVSRVNDTGTDATDIVSLY